MNTVHYSRGLVNNKVKTQVKNVLDDIDGVNKVNVDLQRGTVEVKYNDKANEKQIRRG